MHLVSGKLSRSSVCTYGGPLSPPAAPPAAAARPHLILRPERARRRYAHCMRSLQRRAQLCTRARPSDSACAWSRLVAFPREAGRRTARAPKYILGMWRYGYGDRLCSVLSLVPPLLSAPLLTLSLEHSAVARGPPSAFTHFSAPPCSFRCSSAPLARPPSPPSSAARSPLSPSPPPAVFATYRWSLARCRAAAGRLRVAFRRCGAARRRPQRLRRRSSAAAIMGRLGRATRASQAARAALCRPPFVRALPLAAGEKSVRMSGRFLAFPAGA